MAEPRGVRARVRPRPAPRGKGVRGALPHADRDLALLFVNTGEQGLKAFTATGLFDQLNDESLARTKDRLAAVIQGRLELLRQTHSATAMYREMDMRFWLERAAAEMRDT